MHLPMGAGAFYQAGFFFCVGFFNQKGKKITLRGHFSRNLFFLNQKKGLCSPSFNFLFSKWPFFFPRYCKDLLFFFFCYLPNLGLEKVNFYPVWGGKKTPAEKKKKGGVNWGALI